MACQKCGGTDWQQLIAPGYYQCQRERPDLATTTQVLEGYVPDPAVPPWFHHQANLRPVFRSVRIVPRCLYEYQQVEPGVPDGALCLCGLEAVALCATCQRPMCPRHGRLWNGVSMCEHDIAPLEADRQAELTEAAARHQAERHIEQERQRAVEERRRMSADDWAGFLAATIADSHASRDDGSDPTAVLAAAAAAVAEEKLLELCGAWVAEFFVADATLTTYRVALSGVAGNKLDVQKIDEVPVWRLHERLALAADGDVFIGATTTTAELRRGEAYCLAVVADSGIGATVEIDHRLLSVADGFAVCPSHGGDQLVERLVSQAGARIVPVRVPGTDAAAFSGGTPTAELARHALDWVLERFTGTPTG